MSDPPVLEARRAKWTLPLVVANLKANKTWEDVNVWLEEVSVAAKEFPGTTVFCPSYPFLSAASQIIKSKNINIKLGSQDVSKFTGGAYTGEVTASQLKSLCQYIIVGHSERRQNFGENEEILQQKVQNAKEAGLEPVFCVQSADDQIPSGVNIVAYEPVFAIGTGNPDTPENILATAQKIKTGGEYVILYGGSVSGDNVKSALYAGQVDGVLVGSTNSLDPQKFATILKNAS